MTRRAAARSLVQPTTIADPRTATRAPLRLLALALVLALGLPVLTPPTTSADPGDIGHAGPFYTPGGPTQDPTESKPESKLWFNDGRWWASMWDTSLASFAIFRLDAATQAWSSTGVAIDNRKGARQDALWDGTKLYVGSHGEGTDTGVPSFLYRFSYNTATDTYALDTGFPTQINNIETETLVIDKDSTGAIWATWTTGGQVWVNRTTNAALQWGTAFQPGTTGTTVSTDDISSLIAFNGRIGVMWSNQTDDRVYFAVHVDTEALGTWQPTEVALAGANLADDHINLKQVGGRVLAAVKTDVGSPSSAALLLVLDRGASGPWSSHTVATKADAHTRPIMLIDTTNSRIHVFAAGPQPPLNDDGAPDGGTIYVKSSPLGTISFGSGVGTPVIRDADVARSNNATSTKQNVSAATGMVVLASNGGTLRYWHHHDPLSSTPTAPNADFTGTPTSGAAPLTVAFANTSTGTPGTWAWDFDNNGSVDSTEANPSHTYTTPGTYTVALTASNSLGTDTETKVNYISVGTAGASQTFIAAADSYVNSGYANSNYGRQTSVRASNSHRPYVQFSVTGLSGAPTNATLRLYVTDPSPHGGDLYLVGNGWTETGITWANAPALPATPHATGRAAVTNTWYEFDVTSLISGNGTYSFALRTTSSNGTLFSSREGANPPQLVVGGSGGGTPPPTANFSGSPTSGSAPLTVAFTDSSTGAPTSWAWDFDNNGVTDSTLQSPSHTYTAAGTYSVKLTATNGAGSDAETKTNYISVTTAPTPPTANFSGSPTSGSAPLTVAFTDSSTGAPTSWAWDFTNDGVTDSTLQNPSHTYTAAGTYSVKLTATNGAGSDAETKTNYISVTTAPTPPTANFSGSPTSGSAPLTVAFTDSSTGAPTSWAWDFDNNGVTDSTLQSPSHTYTAAGTYSVKLTATNGAGSDAEIKTNYISVTAPGSGTTFQPVADSYVNSGYVNSNYGTQTSVRATNQHRPYLQFTVSGLSSGPSRVMLRLYVTDPSPHGGDLYLVGNGWTERGITWANAPALPATPHATGRATVLNTWYEFDVTSLVTGNGTYSFALRTTSTNGALYASREAATNRPELVVTP